MRSLTNNWPVIADENISKLDELATFQTCYNLMKNKSYVNQLNSLKEIKYIIMKLPYYYEKTI